MRACAHTHTKKKREKQGCYHTRRMCAWAWCLPQLTAGNAANGAGADALTPSPPPPRAPPSQRALAPRTKSADPLTARALTAVAANARAESEMTMEIPSHSI